MSNFLHLVNALKNIPLEEDFGNEVAEILRNDYCFIFPLSKPEEKKKKIEELISIVCTTGYDRCPQAILGDGATAACLCKMDTKKHESDCCVILEAESGEPEYCMAIFLSYAVNQIEQCLDFFSYINDAHKRFEKRYNKNLYSLNAVTNKHQTEVPF